MKVGKDDKVVTIARVPHEDEEEPQEAEETEQDEEPVEE